MKPFLWFFALAALLFGWGWWSFGDRSSGTSAPGELHLAAPQCATNLNQCLASSPTEIAQYDIALLNLLCAEGLPGAEVLNPNNCISTLDQWAERVRSETERHLYRYRANPREFESSEGYFRMLMMAVVVYEDLSVRYNPERMSTPGTLDPNDHFFADSRDVFLHGLLVGRNTSPSECPAPNPQPSTLNHPLGTCCSMPVLYAAIGRRLGYPLKLVTTKSHLFIRWESAAERFSLEATGKGMNRYDDEHFKRWPFPVTEEEIQADGYLKSLTPVEELALFLSLRGHCLREAGRISEAVASYAEAVRLAPGARPYRLLLAAAQQQRAHPGSGTGVPLAPGPQYGYAQTTPLPPPPRAASPSLAGAPPPPVLGTAQGGGAEAFPSTISPQPTALNQLPDPNPLLRIRQQ